ncbi:MAG: hypothetical protein AAGD14_00445 [Planctomycetota bacterium]
MRRVFVLLGLLALPAFGQTRADLNLTPMAEDVNAQLRYEIDFYLDSETEGGADFDMFIVGFDGRIKLNPKAGRASPKLGFDVLRIQFDTDDPTIPSGLTDTSVAVGFGLGPPLAGWIFQASVGIGWAGDKPYNGRGTYGLASLTAQKILGKGNFLYLGLDFDGNRVIWPDVPLPIAGWTRIWTEEFRTTIGFPFIALNWRPVDWFEIDLRFLPPINAVGGFTFHLGEKFDIFLRYRGANFGFTIDDDPRDNFRTFYTENRVELGFAWIPDKNLEAKVALAWTFERRFRRGFDVRDTDTIARFDSGLAIAVIFNFRF